MSKAALKKEIAGFTPEQLREVILAAYDSSAEAKDYFEFFLNPDIDTFISQCNDAIFKEIKRSKYGRSKGRISEIRRIIKKAIGYGLPPDKIGTVMLNAISLLVSAERFIDYPDALYNGTTKLVSEYITFANKNEFVATALANINNIANDEKIGTNMLRRKVRFAAVSTVDDLKKG